MKQLKACVWIGPSKKQKEQSIKSVHIETFVQENTNAILQADGLGVWAFFSSISEAVAFAHTVFAPAEHRQHSVLITVGELLFKDDKWQGWTLDHHQSLTSFYMI